MTAEADRNHLHTVTRAYREQREDLVRTRAMLQTLAEFLDASQRPPDESQLMDRLQQALAVTCALLHARTAAVLVCDQEEALTFVAVNDSSSASLLWKRLERNVGVAGWVVKHRKPAIVNNASLDGRFYSGIDSDTGMRTQSLLASPIIARSGKPLGVIEVMNKNGGKLFSTTDLRSLSLVAHAVGLLLDGLTASLEKLLTGQFDAPKSQSRAS